MFLFLSLDGDRLAPGVVCPQPPTAQDIASNTAPIPKKKLDVDHVHMKVHGFDPESKKKLEHAYTVTLKRPGPVADGSVLEFSPPDDVDSSSSPNRGNRSYRGGYYRGRGRGRRRRRGRNFRS